MDKWLKEERQQLECLDKIGKCLEMYDKLTLGDKMANKRKRTEEIHEFVLNSVRENPKSIVKIASEKFNISTQAILRHMRTLIDEKKIKAVGSNKGREYSLLPKLEKSFEIEITDRSSEDKIWRENISELINDIPKNVKDICYYAVSEMINNVIDHSESKKLGIVFSIYHDLISFYVIDKGVGIFNKIRDECKLDDNIHAILELSKGKLTTDPKRHSGEGIFFTSRAVDRFSIMSGNLFFQHTDETGDWLLEERKDMTEGTVIYLEIALESDKTLMSIFKKYSSGDDLGFTRTNVPVSLARYGEENLISRSQAKRLIHRFDRFREIVLDFSDVSIIGQGFADELFRVFKIDHPEIHLYPINTNDMVLLMIERVQENL